MSSLVGVVVRSAGFAPVEQQRSALAAAGLLDWVKEIEPRTMEDWHYQYAALLDELPPESTLVVADLTALGLTQPALSDVLAQLVEHGFGLRSLAEGIDTDADAAFFAHVAHLTAAIERGRLVRAREVIARAKTRDTVSPPKAEFVDAALWEAAQH